MADQALLLHGTLYATIYEVSGVSGGRCGSVFHKLIKKLQNCIGLQKGIFKLYAAIDLGNARVCRTERIESEHCDLKWNQSFRIHCAHTTTHITFSIKEFDPLGRKIIGKASMPAKEIIHGGEVDQWLDIFRGEEHKSLQKGSKIHVKVRFERADRHLNWSKGLGSSKFPGVQHTFFPQTEGCRVTLYQDAHVPDGCTPKIRLSGGKDYQPHGCWEDIFRAISNAKHFIYIAGWSVYPHITLLRDSKRKEHFGGNYDSDITLGELLKKKAAEGVTVLMLVWDDKTSVKLLKKDGVMSTHDEDTDSYFRNSRVHCVLCPRNPDKGYNLVEDIERAAMFTHHQKIVVVDSDDVVGESGKRRVVSFIGGLDLCDGRYDTPSHPIFQSLGSVHRSDFHQPSYHGASIEKGGPREPWHDVHCRLEGPVAWDVLANFEQRWRKQGGKDFLVKLDKLTDVYLSRSESSFPDDSETWKVQVFRSIDAGAVHGLPGANKEASDCGIFLDKGKTIERSIQDAYINAIRRAKNFIYIENQYFLGSSFSWHSSTEAEFEKVGAMHLIPKELSLKITSKIEAGERFSVYIVIPMWPEGIPESGAVQAMLHWQKNTMEMMYRDIAKAIRDKRLEADPMDYITFFCLGNRELKKHGEYEPMKEPEEDSDYWRAQRSRRAMIYVHAKTMIVDDEYIIIGSANINQRSMDGGRDTEIAMGAHQPHHLATDKEPAKGQIHGLRMALWHEHTGELHDCYNEPKSLECIRKVNKIATRNWDLYSCQTLDHDLPGHLLRYPIAVAEDGEVEELPGVEFFPDTKAKVLGTKSHFLPAMLTT